MKIHLVLTNCLLLLMVCACQKSQTNSSSSASFEELSEQGRVLCRKGNYIEGMKLLQEANDILSTMNPDSVNPEGRVMFLGNMSNLYKRMGLYEESKQTNSEAMEIAEEKVVSRLPDLWRMRATIYKIAENPDSQVICLRHAVEACSRVEDENLRSRMKTHNLRYLLFAFIESPEYAPDSIPMAIERLEKINFDSPTDRVMIGRGYVLTGNHTRGIPMIEKAIDEFQKKGDTESVDWATYMLARSYASARDNKLFDVYAHASDIHDSIIYGRTDDLLLGMDFKYRTNQLTHEKEILQNELRAKRQGILFISIIAFLVVAALTSFIFIRHRNNKRQLSIKQQSIDTLLAERIALNSRIEELNKVLADNNSETKHHEMIQTILLEKEDEQRFRKTFNDIYPQFIERLRRYCPELTTGNELLCMLIVLNRRNDEIALALGISRESVTTSRYRLRQRFNLAKDIDLNDFLNSKL